MILLLGESQTKHKAKIKTLSPRPEFGANFRETPEPMSVRPLRAHEERGRRQQSHAGARANQIFIH